MLFNDDTIAYLNACRGYALGILIVYRLQIIAVKLGMLQKPTTLEAVKAVQRIYGIEANGRVGAVTWEILLNAQ